MTTASDPVPPRRFKLISCEVLYREMCQAVSRSPQTVDVEFLTKGLHDIGAPGMCARLREALDSVDESRYEAILLGYALCNNGVVGLTARNIPIVLPRGHDCITLFLGSHRRYLEVFDANPGAYFKTTGWLERGECKTELSQLAVQRQMGLGQTLQQYIEQYGEENGPYLFEMLGNTMRQYSAFAFIRMGIENEERFEGAARADAAKRGFEFRTIEGDTSMFQRLVDGIWDDSEFLVVPPHHRIVASYDDGIVMAEIEGA
jgi:hypothetical protein